MSGLAFVDDAWRDVEPDVGLDGEDAGEGVFETVGACAGRLPLLPRHLQRLRAGARALGLLFEPPADLAAVVRAALRRHGHDVARLRLLRLRDRVQWSVQTRRRDSESEPLRVVLARDPRPPAATDAIKAWPRPWLTAARAAARVAGAHDALLWRGEQLLEATAYNVFVVLDGELRTPPADGSILPGIGRGVLLGARLPVVEAPVHLAELAACTGMLLVNSVYGPRLAAWGTSGTDPAAEWLLAARAAWRRAVGR